jgi:protocatechuate 3,4-dioxygenase beta subunit
MIMMKNLTILTVLALVLAGAFAAAAQDNKKGPPLRTVRGQVLDKDDSPLPSAIVFLKNIKTNGVKTYIADDVGAYRFSGLDPNVDYQIHAEHKGMVSAKHTISTLDNRKEIVLNLRVGRK